MVALIKQYLPTINRGMNSGANNSLQVSPFKGVRVFSNQIEIIMSPKLPSTLRQESGDRCVASVVGGYTKFFLFVKKMSKGETGRSLSGKDKEW